MIQDILEQHHIQFDDVLLLYIEQFVEDNDPVWEDLLDILQHHHHSLEHVMSCINDLQHYHDNNIRALRLCQATNPPPILSITPLNTSQPIKEEIESRLGVEKEIKQAILGKYDLQVIQDKPMDKVDLTQINYLSEPKTIKKRYRNNAIVTDKGDKYISHQ